MDRLEILQREFERIAAQTDAAYRALEQVPPGMSTKLHEATYRDWAALLLRYHDTLARALGGQPASVPASMKRSPPSPMEKARSEKRQRFRDNLAGGGS